MGKVLDPICLHTADTPIMLIELIHQRQCLANVPISCNETICSNNQIPLAVAECL
jgi:hypothetical protein